MSKGKSVFLHDVSQRLSDTAPLRKRRKGPPITTVSTVTASLKLAPVLCCGDLWELRRHLTDQDDDQDQWAPVGTVGHGKSMIVVTDSLVAEQMLRTSAKNWGMASTVVLLNSDKHGDAFGEMQASNLAKLAENAKVRVASQPLDLDSSAYNNLLWNWSACVRFISGLIARRDRDSSAATAAESGAGKQPGRKVRLQLIVPQECLDANVEASVAEWKRVAGAAELFTSVSGRAIILARGVQRRRC
eukprot:SAG31_NODE_119_length_23948_cov_9.957105_12_plen_245_part_00